MAIIRHIQMKFFTLLLSKWVVFQGLRNGDGKTVCHLARKNNWNFTIYYKHLLYNKPEYQKLAASGIKVLYSS